MDLVLNCILGLLLGFVAFWAHRFRKERDLLKDENRFLLWELDTENSYRLAKWRTMDTAPKNGDVILVYDPKPSSDYGPGVHEAYYHEGHGWCAVSGVNTDPYDIMPEVWLEGYPDKPERND